MAAPHHRLPIMETRERTIAMQARLNVRKLAPDALKTMRDIEAYVAKAGSSARCCI
jgi:hypothetical protein